jgi:hypothetical protein
MVSNALQLSFSVEKYGVLTFKMKLQFFRFPESVFKIFPVANSPLFSINYVSSSLYD